MLIKLSKDVKFVIIIMIKLVKVGGIEVISVMDLVFLILNVYGLKVKDVIKVSDIFINI